jgi:hypothetical protein
MTPAVPECRPEGKRFPPRMTRLPGLACLLLALGTVAPAHAELVVFEDGRVVKAQRYRLVGDEVEIVLPGGGSYRVDLGRVERIVDDEIVVDEVRVEEAPGNPAASYDLSFHGDRGPLFGTAYDGLIEREAQRYDIDASLVSALIRAESNYAPRAVSPKGARGLMQLMPATARRLSVRRPFDPDSNVRGGVRYLRELVDRFGHHPELVLAAYNAGEAAVEAYGGVPPYRETVDYVRRILRWWRPAAARAAGSSAQPAADSGRATSQP